ncbi:MAG: DUF2924 domain-containing protein [Micropepsaceae bacterium]
MSVTNKKSAPGKSGPNQFGTARSVDTEIESMQGRGIGDLRDYWTRRFRKAPPPIQSSDVLHRLIAWKLQVEVYGDLDAETRQALSRLSRNGSGQGHLTATPITQLRPGTVLVREWRGVRHRVLVLDNAFEHDGKRYKSLTQIARHITGTRWSGPRFFGVDQAAGPGARPVAKSVRSK